MPPVSRALVILRPWSIGFASRIFCGVVVALSVWQAGGDGLTLEERHANILERLTDSVMETPRDPSVHFRLVKWHSHWNETDKAIAALEYALEVDPEHAWRYNQRLADVHYDARNLDAAEAFYRTALLQNPNSRRSLLRYGELRIWGGEPDEANKLFVDAVEAGLLRNAQQRPVDVFDADIPSDQGPWIQASNFMMLDDAMETLAHPRVVEELQKEFRELWTSQSGNRDAWLSDDLAVDPKASGRYLQFWIHNPRYEQGIWKDSCSVETPKICQALQSLNETLQIVRASFEILESGAVLRPRCHSTNAELFVDVCLEAPNSSEWGNNLVWTSAGGQQLPWATGDVVALDGSFEHTRVNKAIGEAAVVLRLAVRHPQLACEGSFEECGVKGMIQWTWMQIRRFIFGAPLGVSVDSRTDL